MAAGAGIINVSAMSTFTTHPGPLLPLLLSPFKKILHYHLGSQKLILSANSADNVVYEQLCSNQGSRGAVKDQELRAHGLYSSCALFWKGKLRHREVLLLELSSSDENSRLQPLLPKHH